MVKNNNVNGGSQLSLVSVLDKLFTGLRDDKSTRAVAQKLLLAIEAEDQAGRTCQTCGQTVPQKRKE